MTSPDRSVSAADTPGERLREQLVRTRVETRTSLIETPHHFLARCTCGWESRRVKRISTARRYMVAHRDSHLESADA